MMPECAAFPAWKGFVIVPKFDMIPEACDALIAIAIAGTVAIEPAQLRARGGGGERTEDAGGMESLLVVHRHVAADQLGPGLIAGDVCDQHVPVAGVEDLGFRQDGGHKHGGRMAAQGQGDVVIIQRMRRPSR